MAKKTEKKVISPEELKIKKQAEIIADDIKKNYWELSKVPKNQQSFPAHTSRMINAIAITIAKKK